MGLLLGENCVIRPEICAAVCNCTLEVLLHCFNLGWVSLSIVDIFRVKHAQSMLLTYLSLLSGGILAGLISDRLEKRASTCGMMLLLAAPTVRVRLSLTAVAGALTALRKFCKRHFLSWTCSSGQVKSVRSWACEQIWTFGLPLLSNETSLMHCLLQDYVKSLLLFCKIWCPVFSQNFSCSKAKTAVLFLENWQLDTWGAFFCEFWFFCELYSVLCRSWQLESLKLSVLIV